MTAAHTSVCPVCGGTGEVAVPVGIRVKELRDRFGMTQEAFAVSIGLSRPSLANIEAGRQDVPLKYLIAINRVHNASIDWLLGTVPRDELTHGEPSND